MSEVKIRDHRDILLAPVVSEKSYGLLDENKYTFVVSRNANKTEIKIAVDQLNTYDVLLSDDVVFTTAALEVFTGQAADNSEEAK